MKTSELTGAALDWAVAKCWYPEPDYNEDDWLTYVSVELEVGQGVWSPSTDWAQGGPIIEQEQITTRRSTWNHPKEAWVAEIYGCTEQGYGPTPLIAAMRCFVASKLGDEVGVPEELT